MTMVTHKSRFNLQILHAFLMGSEKQPPYLATLMAYPPRGERNSGIFFTKMTAKDGLTITYTG